MFGNKIITLFVTIVLGTFWVNATDRDNRYYSVKLKVKTAEAEAELLACPVYDNKALAFSARWDDSNRNHFRMQKLMAKYGFKGTFFVNADDRRLMDFKRLCQDGSDVGSHSMTHPRLASNLNVNRIFWEVAACKAIVEAKADNSVNSYCFSDGDCICHSDKRVTEAIQVMLERCGYHLSADKKFISRLKKERDPVSGFFCAGGGDRTPSLAKFEKRFNKILKDKELKDNPNISLGVHVWMSNKNRWSDFEEILKAYANRPDWWYCSQTDYGGYRKMYRLHKLEKGQSGNGYVEYTLTLPYAADIGSDVPFTLSFAGKVESVAADGENIEVRHEEGKAIFSVNPKADTLNPTVISYTENENNSSKAVLTDETQLQPWLTVSGDNKINLQLTSKTQQLTNVRITYMLPMMYQDVKAENIADINPGGSCDITRQLVINDNELFKTGKPYLLCKVDYLVDGKAERAYAATFAEAYLPELNGEFRDQSYISSLFTYDESMKKKFAAMSEPSAEKLPELQWNGVIDYERLFCNHSVVHVGRRLSTELEKVKSKQNTGSYYAIVTNVEVTSDSINRLITKRLKNTTATFVNGQEITGKAKGMLPLKKGNNRIIFLAKMNHMTHKKVMKFSYNFTRR